ncbi:helix-turn-helix domain-containing protein [Heyndrickxia oleronia]|uniref:helix-turn-helix domain-containing protein n=1 Tax=Heyndrickxia oleronia TaxID=38875 RepID=UPI0024304D42|nr:helix-turn-helix domain-containing protein [Heyndrickxia oleronia]MCI1590256.1 helix-turn-helix domain-containing protein [Heyndrickxia oleronia]MCI1614038.1 helix-turn-helix domain-containing protein [Heyndrickxia oleronia]MCI1744310.1 helix-turn-helix domain-containing protein [Heyndrickxia oleronia]MCI1761900.1 helix-turn-helix domain-containing protein [Heyndrickxia oleronia]
MIDSENDILDVEEVMEILYIGRNYAYKLLNSGELKAFRVGRKWRIPKKCLEEYIIKRARI